MIIESAGTLVTPAAGGFVVIAFKLYSNGTGGQDTAALIAC